MVFWFFVQKTKKPVFEADKQKTTKNHAKSQKPTKKPGPKEKKWFFANPAHHSSSETQEHRELRYRSIKTVIWIILFVQQKDFE